MKNRRAILAGVAILGMVWGLSSLAAGVPSNATAYLGFFALLVPFAGIIIVAVTAIEKAGRRPQDAATETASPKDYTPAERERFKQQFKVRIVRHYAAIGVMLAAIVTMCAWTSYQARQSRQQTRGLRNLSTAELYKVHQQQLDEFEKVKKQSNVELVIGGVVFGVWLVFLLNNLRCPACGRFAMRRCGRAVTPASVCPHCGVDLR